MESRPFRPVLPRLIAGFCLAVALVPAILSPRRAPPPKPAARAAAETPPRSGSWPGARSATGTASLPRATSRSATASSSSSPTGSSTTSGRRTSWPRATSSSSRAARSSAPSGSVYNLETGRGTIERASGLVQPSVLFEAETLERKQDDLYSLSKARLTACTQPNPRWSFGLSQADLKKDDYIEMWDAVVRIKSVPVLYLPYLRYPLKERATGFLMPRIGFAGEKGFSFSQSFYWAMAPNMDATVGVDFYLARGTGAGLAVPLPLPGRDEGRHQPLLFRLQEGGGRGQPGTSSIVRLNHTQALPLGFTLVANVDYQTLVQPSSGEFDNNFQRALSYNRTSQVYLSRSWRRFNLSARASRFETYFSQLDDSNVSTSLPQITFNVFKTRLFAPRLSSPWPRPYSRWQYGWKSEYEAGTERRSSRLASARR